MIVTVCNAVEAWAQTAELFTTHSCWPTTTRVVAGVCCEQLGSTSCCETGTT